MTDTTQHLDTYKPRFSSVSDLGLKYFTYNTDLHILYTVYV